MVVPLIDQFHLFNRFNALFDTSLVCTVGVSSKSFQHLVDSSPYRADMPPRISERCPLASRSRHDTPQWQASRHPLRPPIVKRATSSGKCVALASPCPCVKGRNPNSPKGQKNESRR